MKQISQSKQLVINMSASFVSYGVTLFISFFLSPYIVRTIGVEANGFVGLANNFVSYASLITIALNSLAGRFITISITQNREEDTNRYYTSVFFANLLIAAVLAVVGGVIVVFLDRFIRVPAELMGDVRWLFVFVFLNCVLSVVGSVFGVATFATNQLYLESLRNIEAHIARALVILAGFTLTTPRICYIGLASMISGSYVLLRNVRYTKLLLPQVRIRREFFDWHTVWDLVKSGVWNTVTRMGQILTDGLDLLITNVFIDATAMGVLSLAKTVPSLINSLMGSVVGVFSPNYTILYAQNKMGELLKAMKQSMKIMGLVTNLPIIVLATCGSDFFALWQPTQDPVLLQQLSLLTIGTLTFSGGINCLYHLFTVVNKIKVSSLAMLTFSFAGTICTLVVLKTTSLGIYAVAGISTVFGIVRNLVFTAPYGALCLGQKWYYFYPDIFRPVLYTVCSSVLCMLLLRFLADSWLLLVIKACGVCVISALIGFFIILTHSDREYLIGRFADRLRRK